MSLTNGHLCPVFLLTVFRVWGLGFTRRVGGALVPTFALTFVCMCRVSGVNLLLQHQPALGDTWSHLACVAISLSSSDLDVPCRRAQVSV